MISTPFDLFVVNLGWSSVPSSVVLAIGSQTAMGGVGILGGGIVADVCAITGPGQGSSNPYPVPVIEDVLSGVVGTAYTVTVISGGGGTSPYTYSVISGSLPPGLGLDGSTGVISGTPTTAGTYTFTIQSEDVNGNIGSEAFQIVIAAPSSGAAAYGFVA